MCAVAGGIWRGCIIWETSKGRECWVASEAAEEKGDWGKGFNLPLRKVERAGCLYLVTSVRGIVSSRVLKIAISYCITVPLPQSCPPRGTHLIFSRLWPTQWRGILLQVIKGCSYEPWKLSIGQCWDQENLPEAPTEAWGSLMRIGLPTPPSFWGTWTWVRVSLHRCWLEPVLGSITGWNLNCLFLSFCAVCNTVSIRRQLQDNRINLSFLVMKVV